MFKVRKVLDMVWVLMFCVLILANCSDAGSIVDVKSLCNFGFDEFQKLKICIKNNYPAGTEYLALDQALIDADYEKQVLKNGTGHYYRLKANDLANSIIVIIAKHKDGVIDEVIVKP